MEACAKRTQTLRVIMPRKGDCDTPLISYVLLSLC